MKKKLLILFLINLFNLNIIKSMSSPETTIQKEQREKVATTTKPLEETAAQRDQREKAKVVTTAKPSKETAAQREQRERNITNKRERNITNINQKEKSNPKLDLKQEAEKSMSEIPNLLKKIEDYIENLPVEEKLILKELILNINKIKDELKDNLIKLAASLNSDQATILSLTS